MNSCFSVPPEDVVHKSYGYNAVDLNVVLRIKYVGSEKAAHVTITATTGDMKFEQGATTGAAATTTGDNPIIPIGGTVGQIDMSDSAVDTLQKLVRQISLAADWEAWLEDLPGDHATEVSAANADFQTTLSDQDCTVEAGFAVLSDTSLKTAEEFAVGVTFNGPSSGPHNKDANVVHQIMSITADVTFGGASAGIFIYAVDDLLGTKTEIGHEPLVSGAATVFENYGVPLYQVTGKRIVVQAKDASGAITSPVLRVSGRSWAFGPAVRKDKLLSAL